MNKKQWINNFKSLDPDQQLEVSIAIMNELKDNEEYLDIDDEYNNNKSKTTRVFFNKLVENAETKQDLKKIQKIFGHFQSLTKERQERVIESITSSIEKYFQEQKQEQKERTCQREGHLMEEWQYYTWITLEDDIIDHQKVHNIECRHEEWRRTCTRCGYTEISKQVPKEITIIRDEEERQAKIKKYEKELRRLKNKYKSQLDLDK